MKPFVSFNELGTLGRLGNQLFQYAALRALSLKNDCDFCLPPLENAEWHGQKCLLNKFFNIPEHRIFSWHESEYVNRWYNEPDYTKFDENFFALESFTNISGFFQSILYFEGCQDIIKKELMPRSMVFNNDKTYNPLEDARKYVQSLKSEHLCDIVSLHIRLGDGVDNTNRRQTETFREYYFPSTPEGVCGEWQSYFQSCKRFFEEKGRKVKYLVFTGGKRAKNDDYGYSVQLCKQLLKSEQDVVFSQDVNVLDDFCRIMVCDHSILSPASSLGWWAGYLGEGLVDGKQILAPIHYHIDNPKLMYRAGFYPKTWKLLK